MAITRTRTAICTRWEGVMPGTSNYTTPGFAGLLEYDRCLTAGTALQPKPATIAVLIPCYNEELTVGRVVADFRRQLPSADVYVFDNNSSDQTAEIARKAGANVFYEPRQGKGYVVQSMFRKVDADIYV